MVLFADLYIYSTMLKFLSLLFFVQYSAKAVPVGLFTLGYYFKFQNGILIKL